MGFFKRLFQADKEREEKLKEDTIRAQADIWELQRKRGESPDVYGDLKRIYGIEELERRQDQKQQTKEIIKGAVTGGIIGGDAGAIVGAVVAKNKLENVRSKNVESYHSQASYPPITNNSSSLNSSYQSLETRVIPTNYKTPEWYEAYDELAAENIFLSGPRSEDLATIGYCIAKLGVARANDFSAFGIASSAATAKLRNFVEEGKVSCTERYPIYYTVEDDLWAYEMISNHLSCNFREVFSYRTRIWHRDFVELKKKYADVDFDKDGKSLKLLDIFREMQVMTAENIADLIQKPVPDVSFYIADLLADGTVSQLLYGGKMYYRLDNLVYCKKVMHPKDKAAYVNESAYESDVESYKKRTKEAFCRELEIYTNALSSGVISQEEFNNKKKQLIEEYNAD